ncbi:MAG: hypothetical protein AAGH89_02845 [Verrucomicrobiota bacterium]
MAQQSESSQPSEQDENNSGLNGFQKFLIALSPTVIASVLTGISTKLKFDDHIIPIALSLVLLGAVIAGSFVIMGMKKSNSEANPIVLCLAFLGVFVAYCTVGLFGGCLLAVGISSAV